jgi:hypothetical protein
MISGISNHRYRLMLNHIWSRLVAVLVSSVVKCSLEAGSAITTTLISLIANAGPVDQAIATAGQLKNRLSLVGIARS